MEEVINCIHGLAYDSCSLCYDRPAEDIKEEVERVSQNFNWREPILTDVSTKEREEDFDFDYDFESDSD